MNNNFSSLRKKQIISKRKEKGKRKGQSPSRRSCSLRFFRCPVEKQKETNHQSSGCVACYREPKSTASILNENNPPSIAQTFKKPAASEDFWSTSTIDMDNITFPSQGSISSNHTFDSQSGARNSNAPPEFVNQGLLLWNQTRERWVGKEKPNNQPDRIQGPKLNWNAASYDSLLGSNKLFPQPIPLTEMVDFLVDIWEQEGLYD